VERNATEIEDTNIRLGLLTQLVMRWRTRFAPNQAWRQLAKYSSALCATPQTEEYFLLCDGRLFLAQKSSAYGMESPAAGANHGLISMRFVA
jgi:hypothetical protein